MCGLLSLDAKGTTKACECNRAKGDPSVGRAECHARLGQHSFYRAILSESVGASRAICVSSSTSKRGESATSHGDVSARPSVTSTIIDVMEPTPLLCDYPYNSRSCCGRKFHPTRAGVAQ